RQLFSDRYRLRGVDGDIFAKAALDMGHAHRAAHEAHVEALVAHALLAVHAPPARLARIDGNAHTRIHLRDAVTDRGDDARDLVAERHWLLNRHGAEAAMVIVVQVGAADAAIGYSDADLARAGRGVRIAVDPQVLRRMNDDGAHSWLPA